MTNNGTHTLRRIGLSVLLTLLVLCVGCVGVGVAEGQGVRLSTLRIRVVNSTPQHGPEAGVTLYINDSAHDEYFDFHLREATSDADGYIEFDLGGLNGNYVILQSLLQNYEPYTYDLVIDNGRLVNIEGTVPDSADFCYELMVVPENFFVTLDANGGTIDGEPFRTYESNDANQLVWGQERDGRTAYVKIAYDVLTPYPEGNCYVSAPGGYELDGWYTERVGGTEVEELDTKFYGMYSTIYARWTRAISFNPNGGTGSMGRQTFIYGEPQSLSRNRFKRKDGLRFVGWNTRADGTGVSYGDGQEISSPTFGTLYAQWVDDSVSVLVDSSIRYGTVAVDNTQPAAGATVTLTLTPDTGCEYVQGSLSVMRGNAKVALTKLSDTKWTFTMPKGQVAVSAAFARIAYSVSFAPDAHGSAAVYQPQDSYHYGDRVILTYAPETGYELGSVTVRDAAGNDVSLTNNYFTLPASDVTVYATFAPSEFKIKLSYKGNIEEAHVAATARTGETVTVYANDGYLITAMDATGEMDGAVIVDSSTPAKSKTFTMPPQNVAVRVNCSPARYLVTKDISGGGTVTGLDGALSNYWPYGQVLTFNVIPNDGAKLRELKITTDEGEVVPYINLLGGQYRFTLPASNVTVHVVFRTDQRFTVSFYNGNKKVGEASVVDDSMIYEEQRPVVQAADGKAFLGWYDENDKYFNLARRVTQNMTLKAKFGPAVDSLKIRIVDPSANNKPVEGCTICLRSSDLIETFQTRKTDSEGYAELDISGLPTNMGEKIYIDGRYWTKRFDVTYTVQIDPEGQHPYYFNTYYDLRLIRDSSGTNHVASFVVDRTEEGPQACYEIGAVPKDQGTIYDDGGDPVSDVDTVELPANIREIGDYAFEGAAMAVVYVPDTCVSVGKYAFKDCRNLFLIRLPKNCAIDENAFSGIQVFVKAQAGGTTEAYCNAHDNVGFIQE